MADIVGTKVILIVHVRTRDSGATDCWRLRQRVKTNRGIVHLFMTPRIGEVRTNRVLMMKELHGGLLRSAVSVQCHFRFVKGIDRWGKGRKAALISRSLYSFNKPKAVD